MPIYIESFDYPDGAIPNGPRWTSTLAPLQIQSHQAYIPDEFLEATDSIWTAPVAFNLNLPWDFEVTILLPPSFATDMGLIGIFSDGPGGNPSFELFRASGANSTFGLSLLNAAGVGGSALTSTVVANPGTHVFRWQYTGTKIRGLVDGVVILEIDASDMSGITPAFRFGTDNPGIGVRYTQMKWSFSMTNTYAIAAAPVTVWNHLTVASNGLPFPLAYMTVAGTERLVTAGNPLFDNKLKWINETTGALTDICTLNFVNDNIGGANITAIASHPLGVVASIDAPPLSFIASLSTGNTPGPDTQTWAAPTDADGTGAGLVYDSVTAKIWEFSRITTGDSARVYTTPAIDNNGAAIMPDSTVALWGTDKVGNAARLGAGFIVDASAADGTARIFDAAITQTGIGTFPLMTGLESYGMTVKSNGLIAVSNIAADASHDSQVFFFWQTDGVQTITTATPTLLGGSISGTVSLVGGTITSSQAAMVQTGTVVNSGTLSLIKGASAITLTGATFSGGTIVIGANVTTTSTIFSSVTIPNTSKVWAGGTMLGGAIIGGSVTGGSNNATFNGVVISGGVNSGQARASVISGGTLSGYIEGSTITGGVHTAQANGVVMTGGTLTGPFNGTITGGKLIASGPVLTPLPI